MVLASPIQNFTVTKEKVNVQIKTVGQKKPIMHRSMTYRCGDMHGQNLPSTKKVSGYVHRWR